MSEKLRVVIAQLNLMVGDIQGNVNQSIQAAKRARDEMSADIIVFPELSITGYPAEDLLFRESFLDKTKEAIDILQHEITGIYCIVGHPHQTSQGLFNACTVIYNQTIVARYAKQQLPNNGVFDECRYFTSGTSPCIIMIKDIPVGLIICEDIWHPGPIAQAAAQGARLIVVPNASPFEIDKHEQRHLLLAKRAKATNLPIIYANCIGGQDELIFDGGSMAIDQRGNICQHAGFFNETLLPVDIDMTSNDATIRSIPYVIPKEEQRIYEAIQLGLKDYIEKNNFPGVLIGVSGGIDSALTLALAVDALGKDKVTAVIMPSRYTANISIEDSLTIIKNVGVSYEIISIDPMVDSFLTNIAPHVDKLKNIVNENIQARCRGLILMALSNQSGKLVLITSNRSEMAVGYSTLYGDMAGGFAVLKDVPKTLVYRLVHYRNQIQSIIPKRIIERAPSAELAPNQKDTDFLPPYEILDNIIQLYIDQEKSSAEIIKRGFDRHTVEKIVELIIKSEYKRRQAPIGARINQKSFTGRDRRYPITCGFK